MVRMRDADGSWKLFVTTTLAINPESMDLKTWGNESSRRSPAKRGTVTRRRIKCISLPRHCKPQPQNHSSHSVYWNLGYSYVFLNQVMYKDVERWHKRQRFQGAIPFANASINVSNLFASYLASVALCSIVKDSVKAGSVVAP